MLVILYNEEQDFLTVTLQGFLVAKTTPLFEEALEKASICGKRHIVFQCAQLSTFSSKGIGMLMAYLPYFEDRKISLTLADLCPDIFYVLQMLGLDRYMQLLVRETTDPSNLD
ncbi:STAS domain-containing protein [Nibribacter koreensis]|uniref:STAS domain-containing protein n=1 Tax=Nibribacter koreensis TaxID=1084519 RepID=A0ABP8F6X4_9BACT